MTPFLVQILAMGLTVSQIFSKPIEQFKTQFDPQAGIPAATQLLKVGCGILTERLKDPDYGIPDLEGPLRALAIDTENQKKEELKNPKEQKANNNTLLKKIDFTGMADAYKYFCKGDLSLAKKINLVEVINHYNRVFQNLKDVNTLKNYQMSEVTFLLDGQGKPFSETSALNSRRLVVPIGKMSSNIKKAFVSAEDQNFYKHKGVDLNGLMRAATSILGRSTDRPQGGSTITQQVVKNLLLNDDLTIDRKMREMVLATRLEKVMSKDQILELYLNYISLGRASAGVEMAARRYFGPTASAGNLSLEQAALLAALAKGPNAYSPDRKLKEATDRRKYVLTRIGEDCAVPNNPNNVGCPTPQQISASIAKPIQTVPFDNPISKGGFYFIDSILKEAKSAANLDIKTKGTYVVQSTVNPVLQRATEQALQDGLMNYEQSTGRKIWTGPQGSIENDVIRRKKTWQEILPRVQPLFYDLPWTLATVINVGKPQVGLVNGQVATLRAPGSVLRRLKNYDLIFVEISGKENNQIATLKIPARVQGSAIVMENQTGRVLAVSGGFSYAASQYNRALLTMRQPGSTLKPFVYLAALNAGLQPNTLLPDLPHNPPLGRNWQPKNYDRHTGGLVTFRTAIENSLNLPTVQLAARLGGTDPYAGLNYVQNVLKNIGLYKEGVLKRDFAEVLGSRETRLIDLATAYATVANSGLRPTPYFIESIRNGSEVIYTNKKPKPMPVSQIDRVSFYQLKRILEGTVARGTAKRLQKFEGFIAGKTGTSNDESDAWFVCFTNDLTIAVWVGYDNKKIYRNLGEGSTGGRVALPIVEKILKTTFEVYRKAQKLSGPPDEIRNKVTEMPIDLHSGSFTGGTFNEVFRIDDKIRSPLDTTHALLEPGEEDLILIDRDAKSEEDAAALPPVVPSGTEPQILPDPQPAAPATPFSPNEPENASSANGNDQTERKQPQKIDPAYQLLIERYYMPQR